MLDASDTTLIEHPALTPTVRTPHRCSHEGPRLLDREKPNKSNKFQEKQAFGGAKPAPRKFIHQKGVLIESRFFSGVFPKVAPGRRAHLQRGNAELRSTPLRET